MCRRSEEHLGHAHFLLDNSALHVEELGGERSLRLVVSNVESQFTGRGVSRILSQLLWHAVPRGAEAVNYCRRFTVWIAVL